MAIGLTGTLGLGIAISVESFITDPDKLPQAIKDTNEMNITLALVALPSRSFKYL